MENWATERLMISIVSLLAAFLLPTPQGPMILLLVVSIHVRFLAAYRRVLLPVGAITGMGRFGVSRHRLILLRQLCRTTEQNRKKQSCAELDGAAGPPTKTLPT
jgi:hypothetical protein